MLESALMCENVEAEAEAVDEAKDAPGAPKRPCMGGADEMAARDADIC